MQTPCRLAIAVLSLSLAACGGGGGGGEEPAALTTKDDALRELALVAGEIAGFMTVATDIDGPGSAPPPPPDMSGYFISQVQPHLDFCRTCHVPGGAADLEEGRRFMLMPDRTADEIKFREAWDRTGRGVENSRILRYASGAQTPHAGGAPWPATGAAYDNVRRLLDCWTAPSACDLEARTAYARAMPRRQAPGIPAKAARNCDSGSSVEQDGLAPHRYAFFDSTLDTDTLRRTDTLCTIVDGASRRRYNGVTEFGSTATASNGTRFAYLRDGGGSGTYERNYEEFEDNRLVYQEVKRSAGSIEARETDGARELGAVYRMDYEGSDGFFHLAIGKAGAPFRIISDEQGLRLNGDYDYRTGECRGGAVTVITLEGLEGDFETGFNGGQLKFRSGKHEALFHFNAEGGATLELDGVPTAVPAAELQQTLESVPCG